MIKKLLKKIVEFLKDHLSSVAMFLFSGVAAIIFGHFIITLLLKFSENTATQEIIKSIHHSPTMMIIFELSIAGIITMFYETRKESNDDLREHQKQIKDIAAGNKLRIEANEKNINTFVQSNIVNNYMEIDNKTYSEQISKRINQTYGKISEKRLISKIEKISKMFKESIDSNEMWRLILERLTVLKLISFINNKFFISLEVYCNILTDFLETLIEENKKFKRKLIIRSFTSVSFLDWFEKKNAIGNPLESYAEKLKTITDDLRSQEGKFERYVFAIDSSIDSDNELTGILDFKTLENQWALKPNLKSVYLNNYHTDPNDAYILSLCLKGIRFDNNHTEFVYIGYQEEDKIDWEWCISCGYTDNNLNVSASFIDLKNKANKSKLIINIINRSKIIKDATTQEILHDLSIPYQEFPSFILQQNDEIAKIKRCKDLLPLAEKWELASEIWHSNTEVELIKELFEKLTNDKETKILDCACGTGQHVLILNDLGYKNLSAWDIDIGNVRIFKKKMEEKGLSEKDIDTKSADWNSLGTTSADLNKFDIISCIGSSIPYYKSWKENGNGYEFNEKGITNVLDNFKKILKPNGKLIIGLSRYITEGTKEISIKFDSKEINKSYVDVPSGTYEMTWQFKYNWEKSKREWYCMIKNDKGHDYSFNLVGHLLTIDMLKVFCIKEFGVENVEVVDLGNKSYDIFIVCEKKN